jgi:hypothetical protein
MVNRNSKHPGRHNAMDVPIRTHKTSMAKAAGSTILYFQPSTPPLSPPRRILPIEGHALPS